MTWREKFFGLAEKGTEEELEAAGKALESTPAPKREARTLPNAVDQAAENEQLRALRDMNEALARQNATLRAESCVDRLIADKRATAAERGMLVASYTRAALDDAAHPVASGETTRVEALNTAFGARSRSVLTEEMLDGQPPAGSRTVSGSDAGISDPRAAAAQKERDEAAASVRPRTHATNGTK